jgi:hypothetical protein
MGPLLAPVGGEEEEEEEEEEKEEEGGGGGGGASGSGDGKGGGKKRGRGGRAPCASPAAAAAEADPYLLALRTDAPPPAGTDTQPVLLHMDSLGCHATKPLGVLLRGWALREWVARRNGGQPLGGTAEAQKRAEKALEAALPMLKTDLPMQDNFCDCGVFLLRYADLIVEATLARGDWRRLTAARVAVALGRGRGALPFPKDVKRFSMADIAFLRQAMQDVIERFRAVDKRVLVALSALRPEGGDAGDAALVTAHDATAENTNQYMREEKQSSLTVSAPGLLFATAQTRRAPLQPVEPDPDIEEVEEPVAVAGVGGGAGGGPAAKKVRAGRGELSADSTDS